MSLSKYKPPTANRALKKSFDYIILSLLGSILLVSCLIIVVALFDFFTTNIRITQTMLRIRETIEAKSLTKDGKLEPWAEAFKDRLEALSKGAMESNTVSFLFQIFSVALVGSGAYLLNRSHENVRIMEEESEAYSEKSGAMRIEIETVRSDLAELSTGIEETKRTSENRLLISIFSGQLLNAYQTLSILRTASDTHQVGFLLSQGRESVAQASRSISEIRRQEVIFRSMELSHLLDIAIGTRDNLSRVQDEVRSNSADILVSAENIVKMLQVWPFTAE